MSEIKYLTRKQQGKFLKAIAGSGQKMRVRDLLYFTLSLRYGLRASEGRILEISQVKLAQNSIFIQRLKGSISQFYPLRSDDKALIKKWLKIRGKMKHRNSKFLFITERTGSFSQPLPAKLFEKYAELAGIGGHSCHSCRHSAAVNLLDQGVDLFDIKTWLGHRNIQSTLVYLQIGSQKTQQRMSQILQRM